MRITLLKLLFESQPCNAAPSHAALFIVGMRARTNASSTSQPNKKAQEESPGGATNDTGDAIEQMGAESATSDVINGHIGAEFSRSFGAEGVFKATIVSFDSKSMYWHAQYEDGDEEDLDEQEMRLLGLVDGTQAPVYLVKSISKRRNTRGRGVEYCVQWDGFAGQDTWEPLENVQDTDAFIAFQEREQSKKKRAHAKTKRKPSSTDIGCTACGKVLFSRPERALHPLLGVTICTECHDTYNSGSFVLAEDGNEMFCRWCGDGGEVLMCDTCPRSFCHKCIKRNLGRSRLNELCAHTAGLWACFVCGPQQLDFLRKTLQSRRLQQETKGSKKQKLKLGALAKGCASGGSSGSTNGTSTEVESRLGKLNQSQQKALMKLHRNRKVEIVQTVDGCTVPKLLDLSNGQERVKIEALNEVDTDPFPLDFVYVKAAGTLADKTFTSSRPSEEFDVCCDCEGGCHDPAVCACIAHRINNGASAYNGRGKLIDDVDAILECNPSCRCQKPRTPMPKDGKDGKEELVEVYKTEKDNMTLRLVAHGTGVAVDMLLALNTGKHHGITAGSKLRKGTSIILGPRRAAKKRCRNALVGHGITLRLQVFRTVNKGWGVRCLDDVRAGSFICTYEGELLKDEDAERRGQEKCDEYIMNLDLQLRTKVKEKVAEAGLMKAMLNEAMSTRKISRRSDGDDDASGIPDLASSSPTSSSSSPPPPPLLTSPSSSTDTGSSLGREIAAGRAAESAARSGDILHRDQTEMLDEEERVLFDEITRQTEAEVDMHCIDARWHGNVGRFLNHSCNPNLIKTSVFTDNHDPRLPRLAFFALVEIPAMTELMWDYGYVENSVEGRSLVCQCGDKFCRGALY
jgi:hypothetical protein